MVVHTKYKIPSPDLLAIGNLACGKAILDAANIRVFFREMYVSDEVTMIASLWQDQLDSYEQ